MIHSFNIRHLLGAFFSHALLSCSDLSRLSFVRLWSPDLRENIILDVKKIMHVSISTSCVIEILYGN